MEVIFVLVNPAVPGNIGAAARAVKTMGGSHLRLVNGVNHLSEEAKWMAHGSLDVLENARVFTAFHDAISDLDFTIATTAKHRSAKFDYHSPEQARELVQRKYNLVGKLGIVFGCEESGLKNEDISQCDIAATIPLSSSYPSVNLAQSVMIFAYVFSGLKLPKNHENQQKNDSSYGSFKNQLEIMMEKVGINKDSNLYHRILERVAVASRGDLHLMFSYMKYFKKRFD